MHVELPAGKHKDYKRVYAHSTPIIVLEAVEYHP